MMRGAHLITPQTATSTHYFWVTSRNQRVDDADYVMRHYYHDDDKIQRDEVGQSNFRVLASCGATSVCEKSLPLNNKLSSNAIASA